jgi:hypothetical protein
MRKIVLLVFILSFSSALSFALQFNKPSDTFPPNFGKGKTYLYVVTMPGYFQVNKALEKVFEKKYTGSYEIIDYRDFYKVKQKKGVNSYAFSMIYDKTAGFFQAGERIGPNTDYSCGVQDMETGASYKLPDFGGNYKKVMEKYVEGLESLRLSNEAIK